MLFSSSEILISLVNPPSNGKYDPINNLVSTMVKINFKDDEKIYEIKCGLLGICDVSMSVTRRRYDQFQSKYINETHTITDNHQFLNIESKFNINSEFEDDETTNGYKTFKIPADHSISDEFNFQIPNNYYIPSSFSGSNFNGNFNITYQLYVKIYKIGRFLMKKPKLLNSSVFFIKYQSGKDQNISYTNNLLDYKSSQMFDNKVKKFYFDNEKNALIPTSIKENHTRTRFIRKLWNDDYKNENYSQITKSIPLKIDFQINSLFDIKCPISDQLNLILSSDLSSIGIDSNQTTDFVYNGQSTNLGLFQIESLDIIFTYFSVIKCQDHYLKCETRSKILESQFKKLFLDVKDFDYDKENDVYKQSNLIERLISASNIDLSHSLIELLQEKTILCAGNCYDWFENSVTITCTWKITDGSKQKREYKFVTDSIPDVVLRETNYYIINNEYNNNSIPPPPPPAYEEEVNAVYYDEKK